MISRPAIIALPVALLVVALFPASAAAQVRGMASARAAHAGSASRLSGKTRLVRPARHRFYTGFDYYPYYDSGYEPVPSEEPPVNGVVEQPEQPPIPVASPVESLILENHEGQWVRIPTASHLAISLRYTQPV